MDLHEKVVIRLYREEKCFGPGVAELLEQVEDHRSLRAAAMAMNLAYSKAWSMIQRGERELGFPLLVTVTGGRGGGGATLTEQAKRLLQTYRAYQADVEAYAKAQFEARFAEFR